jgi:hypothetical protein
MQSVHPWRPVRKQDGLNEKWGVAAVCDAAGNTATVIQPSLMLDREDVALICATHNAALEKGEGIFLESLVSSQTGEPRVTLTVKSVSVQLALREARDLQSNLAGVIEASLTDAFIVRWVRDRLGAGADAVGGLLVDFRAFRDEMGGKGVTEIEGEAV